MFIRDIIPAITVLSLDIQQIITKSRNGTSGIATLREHELRGTSLVQGWELE